MYCASGSAIFQVDVNFISRFSAQGQKVILYCRLSDFSFFSGEFFSFWDFDLLHVGSPCG